MKKDKTNIIFRIIRMFIIIIILCGVSACGLIDNESIDADNVHSYNYVNSDEIVEDKDFDYETKEDFEEIQDAETTFIPEDDEYVNVKDYIPDIYIELRYATENNFTGNKIYDFDQAYLRYGTVKKLLEVQKNLKANGYSLKIWDAYRPFSAQIKLWEAYPDGRYVANPKYGMKDHNLGGTVDITLVKDNGDEIPMPTDFDEFSKRADRNYGDIEDEEAVYNVMILQNAMLEAGFIGYEEEWWDYSDTVKYEPIDYEIQTEK